MKRETLAFARLSDPGVGWVSLDRKLAAALAKIAHGEVGRELTHMTTMALSNGQIARGMGSPCQSLPLLRKWE